MTDWASALSFAQVHEETHSLFSSQKNPRMHFLCSQMRPCLVWLEDARHPLCAGHSVEQLWAEGFLVLCPLPRPLGVTSVSV